MSKQQAKPLLATSAIAYKLNIFAKRLFLAGFIPFHELETGSLIEHKDFIKLYVAYLIEEVEFFPEPAGFSIYPVFQ